MLIISANSIIAVSKSETEVAEKQAVKKGKALLKQAKARVKEKQTAEHQALVNAEVAHIKQEQEAQAVNQTQNN